MTEMDTKVHFPAKEKRSWRAMVSLFSVLVLGIALTVIKFPILHGELKTLGEALIIAGVLALTVDVYLKTKLMREVGNLAIQSLFGANAPQEYAEFLAKKLRGIRAISLHNIYCVQIDRIEDGNIYKITYELRSELCNISTVHWDLVNPILPASRAPGEKSRFIEYEASARSPQSGLRAAKIRTLHFTESEHPEIEGAQTEKPGGMVELKRDQLKGFEKISIEPGGTASVRWKGEIFQPERGSLPIITRVPVLEFDLILTGSAVGQLNLTPYVGNEVVQEMGGVDSRVYRHRFMHSQGTVRVEWEPSPNH
ncbi:hypothetical protein [Streptomyces sp. MOE7]|uniref:hypothetical protein n=1 Tax=Streptomyces sp. MOE7 TaxID=1961713 RepID=UPI0011E4CE0D|nr:hypothetical protein [Streptomyces sp. MOE7]